MEHAAACVPHDGSAHGAPSAPASRDPQSAYPFLRDTAPGLPLQQRCIPTCSLPTSTVLLFFLHPAIQLPGDAQFVSVLVLCSSCRAGGDGLPTEATILFLVAAAGRFCRYCRASCARRQLHRRLLRLWLCLCRLALPSASVLRRSADSGRTCSSRVAARRSAHGPLRLPGRHLAAHRRVRRYLRVGALLVPLGCHGLLQTRPCSHCLHITCGNSYIRTIPLARASVSIYTRKYI